MPTDVAKPARATDRPLATLVSELNEKFNLTDGQVRFFMVRMACHSDAEAMRQIGYAVTTLNKWRVDAPFSTAYKEFNERKISMADDMVATLLPQAARRIEEGLHAKKKLVIKGGKGEADTVLEDADYSARAKSIEHVMRWTGKWTDTVTHKEDPSTVSVNEQFAAMLRERMAAKAIELGNVIEGESRILS